MTPILIAHSQFCWSVWGESHELIQEAKYKGSTGSLETRLKERLQEETSILGGNGNKYKVLKEARREFLSPCL